MQTPMHAPLPVRRIVSAVTSQRLPTCNSPRNEHGRTIMLFSLTAAALTAVFLLAIVVTATIA